jgi:predicted aldo/keto reductase-like oxidoreductase
MDGTHGSCGGSRRRFLQSAGAAAGAAVGASGPAADRLLAAPAAPKTTIPLVTLGRTGQQVTKLGMGTSITAIDRSHIQNALFAGIRYIDTSEGYENTKAESVIGEVLERTRMRKEVYLVTKNNAYRKAVGAEALGVFESHLNASLERLRTDYVDCYFIHGIAGHQIGMLRDPGVKAAFAALKKAGKIRFCGLSCHDAMLPEILDTIAEVGWLDQVMFKYNYRDVGSKERYDDLNRAIDKASKANIALVAMKTQSGAEAFPATKAALEKDGIKVKGPLLPNEKRVVSYLEKGFKRQVAALKSVWADERISVAVSEMTNREQVRDNVGASREPLTAREARILEEHRQATAHLYCHGCGHLCETAAKGVPVATVLRYYRYYEAYGKRDRARELYQALPPQARALADADLDAAEAACPFGLPVADLVRQADRRLS